MEHKKIQNLEDFFTELNARRESGVYFYRINGYNPAVHDFIRRYYETARNSGVVIEGKIPNPDEKNLAYYGEMMGMDFVLSQDFICTALKKWLPRMNNYQRLQIATSIFNSLTALRAEGKNDNMLKNAYIKFMCWLYYKFERVVSRMGENQIPKILYEGEISNYELMLISILSNAGCDVVLLQYKGDAAYQRLDATSKLSDNLVMTPMESFPADFSLKKIREEIQNRMNQERLYGKKPEVFNCTNAWIKGKGFEDFLTPLQNRGKDPKLFYNCFYRINGVWDKLTYENDLYQFQLEIKNSKRKVFIIEQAIQPPRPEEIQGIRRQNYEKLEQMIQDLSKNIQYPANLELQRLMNKAFIDILIEESEKPATNLNKLTNKAVYLLCWLKRYQSQLFSNWKMPDISCFILFGCCKNDNDAMFLRFLSRLPVDVLVLNPDLNAQCTLQDKMLYELKYENSMTMTHYPVENANRHIATVAYHAERELDTLMYQDSGIYRNQQYGKAVTVTLQTMYEEIKILWNQELKYRPSFSTLDGVVTIPVIFAKVSGVKDGKLPEYWSGIKTLLTEDTILVPKAPFIQADAPNPMKPFATEFFKNGKLQREKIKSHKAYQYGVLREEVQNHILDKLQILIEQRVIQGTFQNGTEYLIISLVLNMNKDMIRILQKFDFTKKNPKIVYINTSEDTIPLEDSIMLAFLNLVGFDIVFFVPTGYQSVERFYQKKLMEEYQIGEYVYDLEVPDFKNLPSNSNMRTFLREKILKRGT